MTTLIWHITGASSGLGHHLALEALHRGEKVIATARPKSIDKLAELKSEGADVLELNSGTIEEVTVEETYAQYKWAPATEIYASTKWALRSISLTMHEEIKPLGLRATCVDFGFFRTPILEKDRRVSDVFRIGDYKEIAEGVEAQFQAHNGNQPGDPRVGASVVIDIVRGEGSAAGKPFPTSLCLGADCYTMAKGALETTLQGLESWKDVSFSTDFKN